MTRLALLTVTLLLFASPLAAQQSMGADEKQIRDLIVAEDAGKAIPTTSDRVFWSGALKRPIVGAEKGEQVPGDGQPDNRVPGSLRTTTTIRRIEIAKSGDLAYEFSDSELSFQLKTGERRSFPRSTLRVWKKDAGQWKVVAFFARPHEE